MTLGTEIVYKCIRSCLFFRSSPSNTDESRRDYRTLLPLLVSFLFRLSSHSIIIFPFTMLQSRLVTVFTGLLMYGDS